MHNTPSPKQNELMIANFLDNTLKTKLNLGSYRFICFIDNGVSNHLVPHNGDQIMFLASKFGDNYARIMVYQFYPW